MNRSDIGRAIGTDAIEELRVVTLRFWDEWASRYPHLPTRRQEELMEELHTLQEQARGNAIISHVPGHETIAYDPTTGDGLDRPVPSIVTQVDGTGAYVAVWWKSGPLPTDWTGFGGGKWEETTSSPAFAGLARPQKTIVWEMDGTTPVALWVKQGAGDTDWVMLWPISGGSVSRYYTACDIDYATATTSGATINGITHYFENASVNTAIGESFGLAGNTGEGDSFVPGGYKAHLKQTSYLLNATTTPARSAPLFTIPLPSLLPDGKQLCDMQEVWIWFYQSLPNVSSVGFSTGPRMGVETRGPSYHQSRITLLQHASVGSTNLQLVAERYGGYGGTEKSWDAVGQTVNGWDVDGGTTSDVYVFRLLNGGAWVEVYTGKYNGGFPARDSLVPFGRGLLGAPIGSGAWHPVWRGGLAGVNGSTGGMATVSLIWAAAIEGGDNFQDVVLHRLRVEYVPVLGASGGSGGGSGGSSDEPFTSVTLTGDYIPASAFGSGRNLLVSGGGTLRGIDATGIDAGTRLRITVTEATIIAPMSATSGAPIKTPRWGASTPQSLHLKADDVLEVQLRTDVSPSFWRVIGGEYS